MKNCHVCSTTLYPTLAGKFQGRIRLEDELPVLVTVTVSSNQQRAQLRLSPALLVKSSIFRFCRPPDPVYATLLRTWDASGIDFAGYISLGTRRYETGVAIRQRTDYTQVLSIWLRPLHLHPSPRPRLEVVQ